MEENNIVKYNSGIINNVSNAISITSKLLSIAESEAKKKLEKELNEYLDENFSEGVRGYADINYKGIHTSNRIFSLVTSAFNFVRNNNYGQDRKNVFFN